MINTSTEYHMPIGKIAGRFAVRLILPALLALIPALAPPLRSQIVSIHNDYVAANVNTDQKSARFWISAGPKNGYHRFLYHGSKAAQYITSNVIFQVIDGTEVHYVCNTTEDFALGGRPTVAFKPVEFRPYDSIRVVPDTIEVLWRNVYKYDIKMRFVVEKPRTIYDDGADILMEFEYELDPNSTSRYLGIFLMLDGDNGAAQSTTGGGGSGDKSSIMTSNGYFVSSSTGRNFRSYIDTGEKFPEFYHVGNFEYALPLNDILPIHRLRGFSNGGAPLTRPNLFSVGNWKVYRTVAWNPPSVDYVGDVATGIQWDSLAGKGMIRTAFGSNSRGGNNLFHCRDNSLFADIRCVRLIEQKEDNGPYVPSKFAVEMWLSNTGNYDIYQPIVRLVTPIPSEPLNTERATLDPSTPRDQVVGALLPGQTRKLTWYLNLNPASNDTLIHVEFEYKRYPEGEFGPFLDACAPLITVHPFKLPPCDTLAPVIERLGSGRKATAYWDLQTYDRHPEFDYDTGIDSIGIIANDGDNFRLTLTPESYSHCDVSETVKLHAEVVDTARQGRIVFWVRDCQKGDCKANVTIDSIIYNPRPDFYAPTLLSRDSSGSWDSALYPCNARTWTVTILDKIHQKPLSGDYGLGTIQTLLLQNFQTPVITDQRGGNTISDFDSTATLSLTVSDTLTDAEAQIRVVDYAGNDTILYFSYCTIQDFLPPEVRHTQTSPTEWHFTATDSASWDRGLFEIQVVSNLNKNIAFIWPDGTRHDVPADGTKGAPATEMDVEIVNKCDPAELILEFRDTYYPNDPVNHRRFDTIRYEGIPDKLAPNIIIRPGFDGNTYTFDVTVNDIHFINGNPFDCDRGLKDVQVTFTSNLRIMSPLTYISPMEATIRLAVVDTLAIDRTDTLCITAIDSVDNVSSDCAYWPSAPDGKSPVFVGRYNRATMSIEGNASDDRENDRGLGSVLLRNANNLDNGFGISGLRGQPTTGVTINSTDPEGEIGGEIVIQDLYGEILNSPENSIHTVVLPFRLPIARVKVKMPDLIETGVDFEAAIIAENDMDGDLVHSLTLELQGAGPATYAGSGNPQASLSGAFTVLPVGGGRYQVRYAPAAGEKIFAGDVLGTLRFHSEVQSTRVEPFFLQLIRGSEIANDNQDMVISVRKVPTDPLLSQLTLPAPLLKVAGDSLTYINGDCNRVLGSTGAGKPGGIAILAIEPQPIQAARHDFTAVLRGVAKEGGAVEWITADGRSVGISALQGTEEDIARYTISLPENAQPGMYFLRVVGANGTDSRKILIVE